MALSTGTPHSAQSGHVARTPHMYPEGGPAEDCDSSAERKLYYRFRETLGPEFHVIHSAKWNNLASNGRMQPGEADFIIIHPTLGIAILEVKGGRITQHPKTRVWYTINRYDKKSPIKDPYTQAMESAKVLERKLRAVPATRPFAESYRICYGVWFPDIPWHRDGRGELRMLDEQTLDQADMQQPAEALERLMRFAQGTSPAAPLTEDAISALLNLLVPDFSQVESPLSEVMGADDALITHLTDEQADRLMAMWQSHRQMAIPGHAGTGKTAIAMEMAWRLAQTDHRVLLLCTNLTLAEHLRERMRASKRLNDTAQLDIFSLHELVEHVAVMGRVRRSEVNKLFVTVAKDQEAMGTILAANLDSLALRGEAPVYDALLVDEAQDINEPVWPTLRRLLRESNDSDEPAASYFYVFYDPAQRDLPGEWDPDWTGLAAKSPPLTVNCRNSAAIYDLMAEFNPLLRDVPFHGPAGRPVAFRDPASPSAAAEATGAAEATADGALSGADTSRPTLKWVDAETFTLDQVLTELIEHEHVRPEQILVITGRTREGKNATRWHHVEQQSLGRQTLDWVKPIRSPIRVSFTTIRSSKGIESPVVVLAELDGVAHDTKHDQILYTAISRAKHQLIVLASRDALTPTQPGWWQRFFHQRQRRAADLEQPSSQPLLDDALIGPEEKEPDFIGLIDSAESPPTVISPDPQPDTLPSPSSSVSSSSPDTIASPGAITPSPYQVAICDFVRNGKGNGIVSAVAGSGKTSTLLMAAKHITTRNAVFLAFNVHIARTLGQKLRGTPMSASTIHRVGIISLRRFFGSTAVIERDDHKYKKLSHAWVREHLPRLDRAGQKQAVETLSQLADLARKTLTPPSDLAALRSMAQHYSITCDAAPPDVLLPAVSQLLAEGERIASGEAEEDEAREHAPHVIDFTDMIFLPYIWNLPARWRADWVFVDEAQDLNAAQLDLALKCCGPNGRMLFVGDRHQAIYGFSGADSDAFDHIKRVTQAREFPLSVCYRCPKSHLALAREIVPEIEPKRDAEEGIVDHVIPEQLPQLVRKGDLILGRKTAPLVELCIQLIRHQIFARVKGRDIGVHLNQVVQEVTHLHGYTWQRFGHFLKEYERQQIEKMQQFEHSEAEVVSLKDRVAAVRVCYEMFEAHDAAELCRKIDGVFSDTQEDVTLSTIHRTKGLEADRVFLLEPESMPLRWPNQQAWEFEQERNIKYVALTRAKQELYLVCAPEPA